MTSLIRAELVGLRTLRSSFVVPVVLVALAALITSAGLAGAGKKGLTTASQLQEPVVVGAGIMIAVVLAGFAAMHVAGRYRHQTITQHLLAAPRRGQTLAAELLVYGAVALLIAAVTLAITASIAQLLIAGKHLSLGLSAGLVLGVLLAVVLFAILGVAIGVITRSQPVAIVVLVGAFVVEKLLGEIIGKATAYLPYELLGPLLGLNGAAISRAAGALTLTGIAAAVSLIAYVLLARRDVT